MWDWDNISEGGHSLYSRGMRCGQGQGQGQGGAIRWGQILHYTLGWMGGTLLGQPWQPYFQNQACLESWEPVNKVKISVIPAMFICGYLCWPGTGCVLVSLSLTSWWNTGQPWSKSLSQQESLRRVQAKGGLHSCRSTLWPKVTIWPLGLLMEPWQLKQFSHPTPHCRRTSLDMCLLHCTLGE